MRELMIKKAKGEKNEQVKFLLNHGWELKDVFYYTEEKCWVTIITKEEE